MTQDWATDSQDWSVNTTAPKLVRIEPGTYAGIVSKLEKISTMHGEAAKWSFKPDGMDVEVTAITSMGEGNLTKPAEWSRRILGLSDATDMKSGKDIKHRKPPRVNWGPRELAGKPCRFVVEDRIFRLDDGTEETVSSVVNVLPPEKTATSSLRAAQAEASKATEVNQAENLEKDFNQIPF